MDSRLTIDRMRLALPAGYASRASTITRQVAAQLARMPLAGAGQITQLALPALTAHPGESDAALAGRIARAIHTEIGRTLARQATVANAPRSR
jgi:hypothetical protein